VVDLVIADLGMFSIDRKGGAGMSLIELADGVSADEVRAKTAAGFKASLVSMPAAADSRTCALSYRGAAGTSCFQQSAPT
jgi:acyl CoA:acetate/3-ketoacid CoA transferase beta subunit